MAVIFFIITFFISMSYFVVSHASEPACVSRFDYDHKVLQKLVDLEHEQKELKMQLSVEKTKVRQLQSERKSCDSTYIRWGKITCPGNQSSLVYSGYMAGAHYANSGSGANFLCLTSQPLWGHFDENISSRGRIYGVEYEFYEHRHNGAAQFFGQNVYQKNAPCAVCHVSRGTSIMIPGRNKCFDGWTKEYSGYLVAGARTHKQASTYICLDERVDLIDGNESNDDESLLYLVDGECGKSMPCPPYINNRELTCVVCSH